MPHPGVEKIQKVSYKGLEDPIYAYILDYAQMHYGRPPTVREVGEAFRIPTTTIWRYIQKLVGDERLETLGHFKGILIPGSTWIRPEGT